MGVLEHFASWDIFGLRGIKTFWAQKLDKKMLKFIKILNFIKSLCIIFCIKMFPIYIISFPIYYSKKELKHFDLDILVVYGILAQNIMTSIHLYFHLLNCFKYVEIYILV